MIGFWRLSLLAPPSCPPSVHRISFLAFLPTQTYTAAAMADPTKAETEQVFKVLKAQKANKVRQRAPILLKYG